MKYYVYVLQSEKDNHFYVGMTNNISRRLREHNSGQNQSTKSRVPFRLILSEEYNERNEARDREKQLKSGFGREYVKQIVAGWSSSSSRGS